MHAFALPMLAFGLLQAADAPKPDDARVDRDKLQGTWRLAELVVYGEKAPVAGLADYTLTIKGEKAANENGKDKAEVLYRGIAGRFGEGTKAAVAGSLLASMNTASEYGFGAVIAALPGFLVIKNALEAAQKLKAAEAEIVALKGAVTSLQKTVDQLQAAQKTPGDKKADSK